MPRQGRSNGKGVSAPGALPNGGFLLAKAARLIYNGGMASALARSIPPTLAGVALAIAGWCGAGFDPTGALEFQPQLVVRPAGAPLRVLQGDSPEAVADLSGRFAFEKAGFTLEIKPEGWPATKVEVDEPRGMTTVRGPAPRSTLAVKIKGDDEVQPRILELPKKTKLSLDKGSARLDPGRHELLIQADGYIPKRLSLTLKPGEKRQVAMQLDALPGLPALTLPNGLPASVPRPPAGAELPGVARPGGHSSQPSYRAPAPRDSRPAYQPPVHQAPVVRFTPVAPAPQPVPSEPVPMFTPVGNYP